MKKIIITWLGVFCFGLVSAQPPSGSAEPGMTFGLAFDAKGSIAIDELPGVIDGKEKAEVKIMGEVAEVCTKEGCWIRLKTANGTMLVKMKDHAFLVPLSLNGKKVLVNGWAAQKTTSVEMLRHYAEDAGKSKQEIEKITEPKKEIVLQATGIVVM